MDSADKDTLFFDCNCRIGPRPDKHPHARWSVAHLLEDMNLAEIAGALVTHTLAHTYDPLYGNARLEQELRTAAGRLFAAWCILPAGTPGFYPTPAALLRALEDHGVRAVRAVPGSYSLHADMMGPTLAALQEARVLLLLDAGWAPRDLFAFLHELLAAYPRLPVLLVDHTWSQQRHVHRLMQLHENLHIEFSAYQINRGPEVYVAEFGDERLLFGTGGTDKSPGAARAYLDYAQIDRTARERIAGGNLRRLLRQTGPAAPAPRHRDDDPLVAAGRAGRPQPAFVFDAHAHVLHEGGQAAGVDYVMYRGDADGMLEVCDWCGIDRVAMASWVGPVCVDAVAGNEIVHRAMARHPERVVGAATIDPSHLSAAQVEAEIHLRHGRQGFIGMKPYPRQGLRYDDPRFAPWWEFGNEHRLYALLHTAPATGGVAAVGRLAERYPEISWLIAHSGGSYAFADEVAACIREHPNVFAELTLTPVTNRVVEYLVAATDDEHVLFGTDAPMRDPRPQLGWVVWCDLPPASKERILGGNFARIVARARLGSGRLSRAGR